MRAIQMAVAGLIAISAVPTSVAADAIDDAIKARQSYMRVNAFNLGILGAMAKGEREYDAELASALAGNIAAQASMKNGAMWPAGSGNDVAALADKTRALPAIWTTYPAIIEKNQAWADATVALAAAAGDGLEALQANIGPVGQGCGGCHQDFRAKAN